VSTAYVSRRYCRKGANNRWIKIFPFSCWINHEDGHMWAFAGPVAVILLVGTRYEFLYGVVISSVCIRCQPSVISVPPSLFKSSMAYGVDLASTSIVAFPFDFCIVYIRCVSRIDAHEKYNMTIELELNFEHRRMAQ
jgi:hypothetical protein